MSAEFTSAYCMLSQFQNLTMPNNVQMVYSFQLNHFTNKVNDMSFVYRMFTVKGLLNIHEVFRQSMVRFLVRLITTT